MLPLPRLTRLGPLSTVGVVMANDDERECWPGSFGDMDFEAALAYLHSLVALVTLTEDSAEGRKAFFEKRPPKYTGR